MAEIIAKTKFKSRVTKDTAYGRVHDFGVVDNTMELRRGKKGNLFIEWTVGDDDDYAEIGIWTKGKKVTDYDGVFELPKQAKALLRKAGYNLKEVV